LSESHPAGNGWQFWIDVGGTFTDCVARNPRGGIEVAKVLSSSVVKGRVGDESSAGVIVDPDLLRSKDDFFRGFTVRLLDAGGASIETREVARHDSAHHAIEPDRPFTKHEAAVGYELASPEEAPILCMRQLIDLRLDEPIGPVELRLGTTRGTNALLERKGARTAFVTTAGFADILLIGNQDRPKLFELEVRKPSPLFEVAVPIVGRLDVGGRVIEELDLERARAQLYQVRERGIDAIAICLLHSPRNGEHERAVAKIAEELGFAHVSISSECTPIAKLVPRGDTTLVDAYLTPVMASYVESIRASAPDANLRLLTSAGGLSASESFSGKDSVLSGPAGGVVGATEAARAEGLERVIAFDMGGTSTDVSRYDGEFELEYETEKAGVRIATPHLAIETVAAGGGSICDFDGERQTVGPASAGAWPGPACYGSGGPLTVTDLNFYLGRVPRDRFPFPLDRSAVERRLNEITAAMSRRGHDRTPVELATGFLEIANNRMAAAIRRISVARGYDVREYALVTFGGAGAQHACAIANELGMRRVLVPRFAGVLSAQGAGIADVKKYAEAAVSRRIGEEGVGPHVASVFEELSARAHAHIDADEIGPSVARETKCALDLRYVGQDATISVDADRDDWLEQFEESHQRFYGFVHDRREVEIVTARVECLARTGAAYQDGATGVQVEAIAEEQVGEAVFGGRAIETRIVDASSLDADESIDGPAILTAPNHTIVVEPGWRVERTSLGDWMLDRVEASAKQAADEADDSSAGAVDPVRLEIFHQHFAGIAEEMGLTLQKSALSTNVRERLDFSCAVFDADGDLVANAPHIPVHLGAMSECVKNVASAVADLAPGDVVVTNDPFRGGSHLPDVTVVTPVFSEDSRPELLFYTASRAHHAEIGGRRPGSMPPDSESLADEGVLLRNLRVIERGEPRFEELEAALATGEYPSRSPNENLADISAQIAANRVGARLLSRLIEARGLRVVLEYMEHIQSAARRMMEAELRRLEDGVRVFEDRLDDGTTIRLRLEIAGEHAKVDFTGTDEVIPSNLNATSAIVSSAVLYCFRCLIGRDIPLNSGVLAPIEIVLSTCFLSPPAEDDPRDCAAVAGGNVETSQRVVDVMLGALGQVAASQGTMNNLLFGNESFGYYETICGGAGAGPNGDGADAVHTHMTNTRITDPEVLEQRFPARLRRFEIRPSSGGEGLHRGGDGVVREIEFLEEVEVSILSQRRETRPYGLEGGGPGSSGVNRLRRAGGADWETLAGNVTFRASAGDIVRIETPGGGAWKPVPTSAEDAAQRSHQ